MGNPVHTSETPKASDSGTTESTPDLTQTEQPTAQDFAEFQAWRLNQAKENAPEKEPKRCTDVGALVSDLNRLFATHGWTWPEPLDEDEDTADRR